MNVAHARRAAPSDRDDGRIRCFNQHWPLCQLSGLQQDITVNEHMAEFCSLGHMLLRDISACDLYQVISEGNVVTPSGMHGMRACPSVPGGG